jgi:hypothetical protein
LQINERLLASFDFVLKIKEDKLAHMTVYSQLIYSFCQYLEETKQVCYVALNSFSEPIMISHVKDSAKGLAG